MPFARALRDGADLVMGNRFKGGIAPRRHAERSHRYLGNPRAEFHRAACSSAVKIGDFHCGLRGFRRDSMLALGLQATGMEFASEMVVKATLARQRIDEVPTTLSPDGRSRAPHLRSWRDGWRHLRFLLLFSPRWLFLIPGIALLAVGLLIGLAVVPAPLTVGAVTFDVDTLVGASAMVVIGFQAVQFALFTKIYASAEGFLPQDRWAKRVLRVWSLERGLVAGALLGLAGLIGAVVSISEWKVARFGPLHPTHSLRLMVPSATALVVSCQVVLGTFFMSILGIRRTRHPAAEALADDEDGAAGAPPPRAGSPQKAGALASKHSKNPVDGAAQQPVAGPKARPQPGAQGAAQAGKQPPGLPPGHPSGQSVGAGSQPG